MISFKSAALPALLMCLPLTRTFAQGSSTAPATLYLHGNILTGAHLQPDDSSATPARISAFAVTNSTIVAVGTDEEMMRLKGPETQVIDLGGRFVMPGFNDAHTHIASAGQQRLNVNLEGTASLAEMLERIRTYTAQARPGQWIVGAGWDHTKWASAQLPSRADLDTVTAGHPATFERTDGHILVANSAALLSAGISSATQNPEGGKIDRDSTGTPTGIVRETPAMSLVYAKIPPPSPERRRQALELAIADALAHGVTSVQDFSDWGDWLVLESMERSGKLPLRVSEWMDFNLPLSVLQQRRASHPADDPLLHLGMLKAFTDGSLGSRTAAMSEPYADDPNNSGIPRYQQEKLNELASQRASAGFQLGVHAIGDEANHMALNAFSAAEQVGRPADRPVRTGDPDAEIVTSKEASSAPGNLRFRIEHAQVLLPEDFDRFARLGVIASMQPSHLLTDMNWAEARIGNERASSAYAWRSMLDHHILLAFGTDYPVESISPFRGLYAAVTRRNEAGTATFHPEQTITMEQALYAYTQASAFAEFREDRKGRLEPGYLADFVVLDRDLLASTPEQVLHTRVLRTVVGGKTVFTGDGSLPVPQSPAAKEAPRQTPPPHHSNESFVPDQP